MGKTKSKRTSRTTSKPDLPTDEELRELADDLRRLADGLELYGLGRTGDGRLTVNDLLTTCRERAQKAVVGLDHQGAPRPHARKKGLKKLTYKEPDDGAGRALHDTLRAALRWLMFLSIRRSGAPGCRFADCDIEAAPGKLRVLADALAIAPGNPKADGAGPREDPNGGDIDETSVPTGESWSRIMPLRDIADRIYKKPERWRAVLSHYGSRLKHIGGEGSHKWQIRLDGLPENIVKELTRL